MRGIEDKGNKLNSQFITGTEPPLKCMSIKPMTWSGIINCSSKPTLCLPFITTLTFIHDHWRKKTPPALPQNIMENDCFECSIFC